MAKAGRKPKYEELRISERLDSVRGWARHGSTRKEIAEMLGVAESTLFSWMGQYPEFAEAIRTGAREADGEILNAAFRQAVGYKVQVTEVVKVKRQRIDPQTGRILTEEQAEKVEYEKYFEPNPMITRFMLINRLSSDYKAQPTDDGGNTVVLHCVPRGEADGKDDNH